MASVFYAIYDDSATTIPFKMIHRSPITIYRTSNMSLIEEISATGLEPSAVLLEEDIDALRNGGYNNGEVSPTDLDFLTSTISKWEYKS